MIYTASSASIRRTFQLKFRDCSLNGSKGKRTYRLDTKALPAFTDDFNRSNSSDISTGTISWQKTRGDWEILSNQLYSPTNASSYPMATVRTNTKNSRTRIGLGGSGWGWGVAFWVTDENTWFSATTDQYTSSGAYSYYTCPNGGTLSGTTCLKTCVTPGTTTVSGGNCCFSPHQTGNCTPTYPSCTCYDTGGCNCPAGTAAVDGGSCLCYSGYFNDAFYPGYCSYWGTYEFAGMCWNNVVSGSYVPPYEYNGNCVSTTTADTYYSCNYSATLVTGTSTAHLHRLVLRKSVAGTVTTVATSSEINTSETARPTYVNVLSSGSTVTITAPMNNGSGTLTMTYNSGSGDSRGVRVGVVLSPTSGGAVASTVDNFEYEPVVV